jgi:hypothetical protein
MITREVQINNRCRADTVVTLWKWNNAPEYGLPRIRTGVLYDEEEIEIADSIIEYPNSAGFRDQS